MQPTEYRRDVDALRGIAVLSVLLFHFEFKGFAGGFVGVDIFFVISGYLISRNIRRDVDLGRFRFGQFYLRRAKRLMPALLVTICITFAFGALLLNPEHLAKLGKSAIFALGSLSNILFWMESGYFDTSAEFKPLLHTWSLSVEEQFYLFWPATYFFILKLKSKKYEACAIAILCVSFLLLSEVWIRRDASAAYFLTPFRMAEFALGAILVYAEDRFKISKLASDFFSLFGLLVAAAPVFLYNETTRFPGVNSMLPCIGSAVFIFAGKGSRLASSKVSAGFATVGVLSYSLYLVHWPFVVFYKYWSAESLSTLAQASLLVASLGAACLLYSFVEQPLRTMSSAQLFGPKKAVLFGFVACVVFLCGMSLSAWRSNGWVWRIGQDYQALINTTEYHVTNYGGASYPECGYIHNSSARTRLVVLGDSHALQYAAGLHEYLGKALGQRIFVCSVS